MSNDDDDDLSISYINEVFVEKDLNGGDTECDVFQILDHIERGGGEGDPSLCAMKVASGLLVGGSGRADDAELRRLIHTQKMARAHRRGVLSASVFIPSGTCLGSASSLCFRCFLAALVEPRNDDREPFVVS
ncbi:hypothetical protein EGR_09208 [Echinococcus granulosus]|uniref:Uncharacterized protein n=1 Tax=Echinococcus granulosus TaxID=6210 RepID=W6U489_ECHGR|nr:hypothetical protein EGR_09208 [Echinococcus granulosus]EUB55928.1 hypothetical protein EGR_09208 [Echinococcus granulosus]